MIIATWELQGVEATNFPSKLDYFVSLVVPPFVAVASQLNQQS